MTKVKYVNWKSKFAKHFESTCLAQNRENERSLLDKKLNDLAEDADKFLLEENEKMIKARDEKISLLKEDKIHISEPLLQQITDHESEINEIRKIVLNLKKDVTAIETDFNEKRKIVETSMQKEYENIADIKIDEIRKNYDEYIKTELSYIKTGDNRSILRVI